MKILFWVSSFRFPNPSWHLMKALMEDVLKDGIFIHAIQRTNDTTVLPTFPDSILSYEQFSFSEVTCKSVDKKNFVKRYLSGIDYAWKTLKLLKRHDDYDLLFLQSSVSSFFNLYVARRAAKKRPVIFNSQDMFPGSAIANGSMPQKWMQKIFYWMQKQAYKKATVITAISEDMKQKLIEQGVPAEKIRVIVNWYDDQEVREIPWEENQFVSKFNLSKDCFYVQYAGTMGTNFNPDIILQVAEKLMDEKNIVFQMIGSGIRREKFEQDAKKKGLDNIVFLPLQPQNMVSDVYSASSVCVIPLKQGVIGNSVPSKAALLMACGRICINSVDKDSDYGDMFQREKIGFTAGTNDAEMIANDILYLYHNPVIKREYENRAKEFAARTYSRRINTKKYIELFHEFD